MRDRTRALRAKARAQAMRNFGLELSREDHDALVEAISHGRREFVGRRSNRLSVFKVEFGGREMKVIYDRHRKIVTSMLPPDADVWVLEGEDDGQAHSVVEVPAHAHAAERGPLVDDSGRGTGV